MDTLSLIVINHKSLCEMINCSKLGSKSSKILSSLEEFFPCYRKMRNGNLKLWMVTSTIVMKYDQHHSKQLPKIQYLGLYAIKIYI